MGEPALFGPDFDRDPSPAYAWLRERPPHRLAFPTGISAWLITRYDDAIKALNHPALVKSPFAGNEEWQRSGMGLPLGHGPAARPPAVARVEHDQHRSARAHPVAARLRRRVRPAPDAAPA
ncbi:cytochrome P450 [Amycolatopsis mediterranei]|uniref:cytochrome P450 n=1 Tax=Amycolatopsis mediterranei TaxID=33910 RepID=UPI0002FEDDB6|nr:cytochrome P450 [Amycolatopsis mediterranei]UZF75760.1 cytochrome P450 [Amycolatopsis mediterranei]